MIGDGIEVGAILFTIGLFALLLLCLVAAAALSKER